MAKMENSAKVLAVQGPGLDVEKTISTRKIDNGYLTRVSEYNSKTGGYKSRESFSPTPSPSPDKGNALSDTMNYLKDCH